MPASGYRKQRIALDGGQWSIFYCFEISSQGLKFEDLHPMSSYVRQQDIARMHYSRAVTRGEESPHIMTWTAMQTDRRAEQMFPGLEYSHEGENIISANSFVTCALRHLLAEGWLQLHEFIGDTYEWKAAIPAGHTAWNERAEALTRWLEQSIQLDLYPNIERGSYQPRLFHDFDACRNFVRIGRCDFIRHFVQNHERAAAFNTSHFLHEHDDLVSHHSGYGDAIGLMVSESTILRPPIYCRGCLIFDGESWHVKTMSLADIELILPGDINLRADINAQNRFYLNPNQPQPIAIYTRAGQLDIGGAPLDRTPSADTRTEYVIVNRQILSWKQGGNLRIPQNGFVLSVDNDALPHETMDNIARDAWIEYQFADRDVLIKSGIQAGPILLQNGHIVLDQATETEEFWASRSIDSRHVVGITPVNMHPTSRTERIARTALGIRADGSLLLVVVDGCDSSARTELDSAGATLYELAEFLADNGAVQALNLSGEGSAHLFVAGGLANQPSDRRGHEGVVFERMIPSIGIVG